MNSYTLSLVIISQVAVFQFLALAFTRSLFTAHLGPLPEPLNTKAAGYFQKARRYRFGLGIVLLVVALITLVGIPADAQLRKLILAALSLTSSAAFAYASIRDRRAVRTMRNTLPDAGVRHASLRPRSLPFGYRAGWEVLPITILVATVVLTITIARRLGELPTEMWVFQFLQAAFVIGALLYTSRHGAAVPNLTSRLAVFRDRPDMVLAFGERLAACEMRYFMLAKVFVALLLGVSVIETGMEALSHGAASWLGFMSWAIVGLLLVFFATFVLQIATMTRHTLSQVQHHGHEERR